MALTRKELDRMTCAGQQDKHDCSSHERVLFLNSRCHTGSGNEVEYNQRTGVLTVRCIKCKKLVVIIAVAETSE